MDPISQLLSSLTSPSSASSNPQLNRNRSDVKAGGSNSINGSSANSLLSILQQQPQPQQQPSTNTNNMDDVTSNYTLIAQMKSTSTTSSISAHDEYLVYVNKKGCRVINMNNTTFTVIKKTDLERGGGVGVGVGAIKRVLLKKGGLLFIEYSTTSSSEDSTSSSVGVNVYRIQHSFSEDDDDELQVKMLREYSCSSSSNYNSPDARVVETNSPEGCLYRDGRYEFISIKDKRIITLSTKKKYSKLYRVTSSVDRLIGYDDDGNCFDLIDGTTVGSSGSDGGGKVLKSIKVDDSSLKLKLVYYCNGTLYYIVVLNSKDSNLLFLNCLNDELEYTQKDLQLPKEISSISGSSSGKLVMRNQWIYSTSTSSSFDSSSVGDILRFHTKTLKLQRISPAKKDDGRILEYCVYGRELYCVAEYGVYMLEIESAQEEEEEEEEEELKEVRVLEQQDQVRKEKEEVVVVEEEEEIVKGKDKKIIANPFGLVKENSPSISPSPTPSAAAVVPAATTTATPKKKGIKILQRNPPPTAVINKEESIVEVEGKKEEGKPASSATTTTTTTTTTVDMKEELERFKKDLEKIIRRECKSAADKVKEELLQSVKMEMVQMKKEILQEVKKIQSTSTVMMNGTTTTTMMMKEKTVLERALDFCRDKGDYEHAFVLVLESMDEHVLMEFLDSDIFSGSSSELDAMKLLSQAVLISLLHFLISSGFGSMGEKKISWIERAALCIQKNHPVTRQYSHVLKQCADRMEGHCSAVLVRFVQNLAE